MNESDIIALVVVKLAAKTESPLLIGRRLALLVLLGGASALLGQALPTASRLADAQVGGGFILAKPDYVQDSFHGFAAYADLDFRRHLGVEAEFHQIAGDRIHERTYEIGGRYFHSFGPLVPYVKAMIGAGDFDYPGGFVNLAYTMYAGGGGADLKIGDHLRLRGDYEFQKWTSFPNGGLTPQLVTIGAAYHFSGRPRYK